MSSPREAAVTLFQILDRLNIVYALGGSFASSVHGLARATQDIDVVIDLSLRQIDALYKELAPCF